MGMHPRQENHRPWKAGIANHSWERGFREHVGSAALVLGVWVPALES